MEKYWHEEIKVLGENPIPESLYAVYLTWYRLRSKPGGHSKGPATNASAMTRALKVEICMNYTQNLVSTSRRTNSVCTIRTNRLIQLTATGTGCANHMHHMYTLWKIYISRSWWPRGLRRGSAAARLLGLWVQIPPGAWTPVSCGCCVLSGRGLCDVPITRPVESYRLWCVWVWSWSLDNDEALAHWGCCAMGGGKLYMLHTKGGTYKHHCFKHVTNPSKDLRSAGQLLFINKFHTNSQVIL